jgi:hypothetical protein
MSKRVLFVCLSLCVIGLLAVWDLVHSILAGQVHLTMGVAVLFLPIAFGLMMGSPFARTAACGVFILTYLIAAWMLLAPLFITASAAIATDTREAAWMSGYPVLLVGVMLVISVLGTLHWLLYSPAFDEHLSQR